MGNVSLSTHILKSVKRHPFSIKNSAWYLIILGNEKAEYLHSLVHETTI